MAILPHTFDSLTSDPVTIYGETANLSYFLAGTIEPDTQDGFSEDTASVDGHTRSRYPGDPYPINVKSHTRRFLVDPTRKSGNSLPGKSFVLAALNAQDQVVEKRQFTYTGDWNDLHEVFRTKAKTKMYAWNNTGARSTIPQFMDDDV